MQDRGARVTAARALRDLGKSTKEIAFLLGLERSTVDGYFKFPAPGARKKAKQGRPCSSGCGNTTTGKTGLCKECIQKKRWAERKWNPESIRAAFDLWIEEHGSRPMSTDWLNPKSGGKYPGVPAVQREFGSWRKMVIEFGYDPGTRRDHVPLEQLFEELREASKPYGVAPSTSDVNALHKAFQRKGLTWQQACDMAGVKTRASLYNW